ncbi:sortase B protein-sorting domain-containing protein [Xenorhabdus nematophila]
MNLTYLSSSDKSQILLLITLFIITSEKK